MFLVHHPQLCVHNASSQSLQVDFSNFCTWSDAKTSNNKKTNKKKDPTHEFIFKRRLVVLKGPLSKGTRFLFGPLKEIVVVPRVKKHTLHLLYGKKHLYLCSYLQCVNENINVKLFVWFILNTFSEYFTLKLPRWAGWTRSSYSCVQNHKPYNTKAIKN